MDLFADRPKHFEITAGLLALTAATAAWVEWKARRAERDHPPRGKFIHVDGVRLHYVMRGEGPPVVLVHGNTVTHADFEASGLMDRLAPGHRVIAFDRPGFGHSSRPRDRDCTPAQQADLLRRAVAALGLERPVVVGHSLGTEVALAMALDSPGSVAGLVLLGGYYYPTVRLDALLMAPVAWPVVGDVLRHTGTALTARLGLDSLIRHLFAPNPVPPGYLDEVPRELLVRPSQLRANAQDAQAMRPQAKALAGRYSRLRVPVMLIAGAQDPVVDPQAHTQRLHGELVHSELLLVPQAGHMVHHVVPELVAGAVDTLRHKRSAAFAAAVESSGAAAAPAPPRAVPQA